MADKMTTNQNPGISITEGYHLQYHMQKVFWENNQNAAYNLFKKKKKSHIPVTKTS